MHVPKNVATKLLVAVSFLIFKNDTIGITQIIVHP